MAKTAMIHARMEPRLKNEVETLFGKLGLSVTEAITLFYRQVKLRHGIPFAVVIPTAETRKVFEDTDAGQNITRAKDADDLFRKLGV